MYFMSYNFFENFDNLAEYKVWFIVHFKLSFLDDYPHYFSSGLAHFASNNYMYLFMHTLGMHPLPDKRLCDNLM